MSEIREIKSEEYDFLLEMLYEAVYIPVGKQKPPKSMISSQLFLKYVGNFGRRGDFGFVLVFENELVGAAWTRIFSRQDLSYGFVDEQTPELSIAIKENFRNQGFGGVMIQKLFEKLRSEGFEKLSLSVDKRNPAVKLYLRLGFEIFTEEEIALKMLKKL